MAPKYTYKYRFFCPTCRNAFEKKGTFTNKLWHAISDKDIAHCPHCRRKLSAVERKIRDHPFAKASW